MSNTMWCTHNNITCRSGSTFISRTFTSGPLWMSRLIRDSLTTTLSASARAASGPRSLRSWYTSGTSADSATICDGLPSTVSNLLRNASCRSTTRRRASASAAASSGPAISQRQAIV